jgi:hypothetical protein
MFATVLHDTGQRRMIPVHFALPFSSQFSVYHVGHAKLRSADFPLFPVAERTRVKLHSQCWRGDLTIFVFAIPEGRAGEVGSVKSAALTGFIR